MPKITNWIQFYIEAGKHPNTRVRALGELEGKLREITRVAGCGPRRVNYSRILRVTVSSEPPQGRNAARIRVRCRVRGGSLYMLLDLGRLKDMLLQCGSGHDS